MRDSDERLIRVRPEPVQLRGVHLRVPENRPDEAAFYLLSILLGVLCGGLFLLA